MKKYLTQKEIDFIKSSKDIMTAEQIASAINRNEQTVYKHLRGEVKTLRVNAAVKKIPKKPMEPVRSYVMPDKEFFDERDFPEYF